MYLEITLFAFLIDKFFGEFKYIRHPVILMGDYIQWFEKKFYKDSKPRGGLLTLSLLSIVFTISCMISQILPWYLLAIIASTGIASNMLFASVKDIINNPHNIKYLVSRDTENLTQSDINKATIETYGENLSDGIIAPLFYLAIFGIVGLFIYKAINTLDSMVGYKNEKYQNFGKFSAKLDDVVNYIPARITALLIALLFFSKKSLQDIFQYGHLHESPNAGYPISAMAGAINVTLGGDTQYFGKVKKKAKFGNGKETIEQQDIINALSFQKRLELFVVISFIILILLK